MQLPQRDRIFPDKNLNITPLETIWSDRYQLLHFLWGKSFDLEHHRPSLVGSPRLKQGLDNFDATRHPLQ
jgi:hypothetical protein